jgi:hypothetical protein
VGIRVSWVRKGLAVECDHPVAAVSGEIFGQIFGHNR